MDGLAEIRGERRRRGTFRRFLCQRLGDLIPCNLLPRRLRILGHVAILWLDPQLLPYKELIGQAVMEFDPRIRSVLRRTSAIGGPFRQPSMELIAGSSDTETSFKENGCIFNLDPSRVMFCLGNKAERMRMSRLGGGEMVVDMFAGIGQFSIPMAVHARPRIIHSIEWNPEAFHYLQINIQMNRVDDIVKPHFGDAANLAPRIADGQADRVVMGLIQGTTRYLEQGISCLRPRGILHFHEVAPRPDAISLVDGMVKRAAREAGRQAITLGTRIIKSYNSRMVHVVVDTRIN